MIKSKKGIAQLLVLSILFLVSGIIAMVAFNAKGYIPDESLGQSQIELLLLKEDASSALSRADFALKYSATKSIFDLMNDALIENPECGYHINPLITDNCKFEDSDYKNYLIKNFDFYTENRLFVPQYEFEVEQNRGKTVVKANPKEKIKIFNHEPISISSHIDLLDVWPSNSKNLSSCYENDGGIKISGYLPNKDIAEVYPASNGIVESICINRCNTLTDSSCQKTCDGFGTNIVISHNAGYATRYTHLNPDSITVSEGDEVFSFPNPNDLDQRMKIAEAGNSGDSSELQIGFLLYKSVSEINNKNSELSPLCFFSLDSLDRLDFKNSAISCQNKYSGGINLTKAPYELSPECKNLPFNSIDKSVVGAYLSESKKYDKIIATAAKQYNIPEALLKSIITIESSFKPDVRSPTGPVGIMQFAQATAERYGLKTNKCCTDQELDSKTCNLNTQLCTANNDERFIPEKAIPAGAKLISELYYKYGKNIYLAALGYHSGEGASKPISERCPNLGPHNVDNCVANVRDYNRDSSADAVIDYVNKLSKFYPAWGGMLSVSTEIGSYYEVNPYTETELDLDISLFNRVQVNAENIMSNCEGDNNIFDCVETSVQEINDDLGGIIPYENCVYFLLEDEHKNYRQDIINFVEQYENCKNYDWNEILNHSTDSCSCGINYPDINGLDIRISSDKIQFIKEGSLFKKPKVIYEHYTAPESPRVIYGNTGYFDLPFTYDSRVGENVILLENGEEMVEVAGGQSILQRLWGAISRTNNLKDSYLSRDEQGMLLNLENNQATCIAQVRTYSFCFDTGQKVTGYNPASKSYEFNTPLIVPFSIKID